MRASRVTYYTKPNFYEFLYPIPKHLYGKSGTYCQCVNSELSSSQSDSMRPKFLINKLSEIAQRKPSESLYNDPSFISPLFSLYNQQRRSVSGSLFLVFIQLIIVPDYREYYQLLHILTNTSYLRLHIQMIHFLTKT